jgi:hypothetical protein
VPLPQQLVVSSPHLCHFVWGGVVVLFMGGGEFQEPRVGK